MARRFRSIRPFPQSQRRLTDWIGGSTQVATDESNLLGTTAVITLAFDTRVASQTPQAPFTIVRLRGTHHFFFNNLASSLFVTGAIGIAVVSGEAFDAGVGSLITPWSESQDDRWLYHEYFSIAQPFISAAGSVGPSSAKQIDSKAMRKVNFGDVVCTIIENASSDTMSYFVNHRMLVKLT